MNPTTITQPQIETQAKLNTDQLSASANKPVSDTITPGGNFISSTTSPNSTTDASKLGSVKPVVVPPVTPNTLADGISGLGDASIANHQSVLDKQTKDAETQAQAKSDKGNNAIQSLMDTILGNSATQNTLETQNKVPEYTKLANDAYTALTATKQAHQKELDALANTTGNGGVTGSMDVAKAAIDKKYASIEADQGISLDSANHSLTSANATVDAKMKLITDAQDTQLKALEYFQTQNADQLSKAEQNQLDQQKAELTQSIKDKGDVGDALKALLATGQVVTPEQSKAITESANGADAYAKISSLGFSLQNPLDEAQKRATLAKTYADISGLGVGSADVSSIVNNLNDFNGTKFVTKTDLEGYTPKQIAGITASLGKQGIKSVSAKDADALNSITAAKQNLSDFQDFILTKGDGGTPILPTNWLGQPKQLADVKLNEYLQVNNQLSGFNAWKLQVVPLLTAIKGAGSSGGGSSRLFGTITDLLPQDTDTVGTAQDKISNITKLLDNGANAILGKSGTTITPEQKAQVPAGSIAITRNGVAGFIPTAEFNPKTDKKI